MSLEKPCDPRRLQMELYERHAVEVPLTLWEGQILLRVSLQGYNDEGDADALLSGLDELLGRN